MSKVLVDRELLDSAATWLEVHAPGGGCVEGSVAEDLRAILEQPAEAEGTGALDELLALFPLKIDKQAFVINGGAPLTADGDDEFLSFKKVDAALGEIRRLAEQGRAALSAVTAERGRLREQCELNDLVHGTKGRERVTALLAQNEELRKDATRLDWLDGYIVIAEHEDTGKFAFNSIKGALRECVDAAMAAKEA